MAKEVLETFAAAKRAADALAGGGGKAAADRCVEALGRLRRLPVTVDGLFAARAVKSVRGLTKNPDEKIKVVASDLLKSWKDLVVQETSRAPRNPSRNGSRNPSNAGVLNGKKSSSGPKPSPKCKAAVREKHREILAEAFSRVSKETRESKRDEVRKMLGQVDACDPILAAVTVGSAMFHKLGAQKYRSVMFNLKDGKNPDFRRRVLLGQIDPEDLGDLTPEEMASDERKRENRLIREKALWHCSTESQEAPKATTDQFTCGRCRQQKTTYYQLQTRSADEPMTTYVTCVNCNNRWKFC